MLAPSGGRPDRIGITVASGRSRDDSRTDGPPTLPQTSRFRAHDETDAMDAGALWHATGIWERLSTRRRQRRRR